MRKKILVVDDEEAIRLALVKFLNLQGYDAQGAGDGTEAIELCKNQNYDLMITDLKMPSMSGIELIQQLKKLHPELVCIVMTAFGTIENAVQAIKSGAFHYVTKPFELDDVALLVEKALQFKTLKDENTQLKQQVTEKYGLHNIVGCSEKLKAAFKTVNQVSQADTNVLILGESGTGKELFAKAIHYKSKRANKPLITVNCGAIPENLLESELFGYMKGAFTGAVSNKIGKFQAADGGTIFLDEIGDMSLSLQVKLLRVLQEKCFEPVGSTQTTHVDVRVIAATHQDLEKMVQEGRFRQDLYYRLNVIPLHIPPLRERLDDLPLLIDYFARKSCKDNKVSSPLFDADIIKVLCSYKWPGNVRELQNTIERLVVLKPGQKVSSTDLPAKFSEGDQTQFFKPSFAIPDTGISLKNVVEEFENTLICKALDKTGWNKNQAATLLKLNRTTLVEKIKKKNLVKPALNLANIRKESLS